MSKRKSFVDSVESDSLDNSHELFLRWLFSSGSSGDVTLFNGDKGVGVKATRDFKEGEIVWKIPKSLAISSDKIKETELGKCVLKEAGEELQADMWIIMVFAITEKWNKNGFWFHYFNCCPKKYQDPMWWSDEEIDSLRGTNMMLVLTHRKHLLQQLFELMQTLRAKYPELFDRDYFLEDCMWAFSLYSSRSFPQSFLRSVGTDVGTSVSNLTGCLLPLFDSFNHDFNSGIFYYADNEFLYAKTKSVIKKNDEIFISYGDKGNNELLLNYGFSLPFNVYDSVSLQFLWSNDSTDFDKKIQLLDQLKLETSSSRMYYLRSDFIPSKLLESLQIIMLSSREFYSFEESSRSSFRLKLLSYLRVSSLIDKRLEEILLCNDFCSSTLNLVNSTLYREGQRRVLVDCLKLCDGGIKKLFEPVSIKSSFVGNPVCSFCDSLLKTYCRWSCHSSDVELIYSNVAPAASCTDTNHHTIFESSNIIPEISVKLNSTSNSQDALTLLNKHAVLQFKDICSSESFAPILNMFSDEMEMEIIFSLFILHEYGKVDSFWSPWFNILPSLKHLNTPYAWSLVNSEYNFDIPACLLDNVSEQIENWSAVYEELVCVFETDFFNESVCSWDMFLWSCCIVKQFSLYSIDGDNLSLLLLPTVPQWTVTGADAVGNIIIDEGIILKKWLSFNGNSCVPLILFAAHLDNNVDLLLDYGVFDIKAWETFDVEIAIENNLHYISNSNFPAKKLLFDFFGSITGSYDKKVLLSHMLPFVDEFFHVSSASGTSLCFRHFSIINELSKQIIKIIQHVKNHCNS